MARVGPAACQQRATVGRASITQALCSPRKIHEGASTHWFQPLASTGHGQHADLARHMLMSSTPGASPQLGLEEAPPPIVLGRRTFMGAGSSLLLAAACPCCGPAIAEAEDPFAYGEEAGPLLWGGTCAVGAQQSPVDLPLSSLQPAASASAHTAAAALRGASSLTHGTGEHWEFKYGRTEKVGVFNTGRGTPQVRLAPGNIVQVGRRRLELRQFHFHTPSEHALDGGRAAMEAHLVHKDIDTGEVAVLAVLLQPGASRPNRCLQQALQHVPAKEGDTAPCPSPVDPAGLLPPTSSGAVRPYVHYVGSLTTPPCSEQVQWFVFETPVRVTNAQVLEFMHFAGGGTTYGHNARPLQPLNKRPLEYYFVA